MCRTGMCRFGIGNWIFLLATLHLFTYAQGGEEGAEEGVRFAVEPSDAVVARGESALLACAARAARGARAPPARLAWRHSAAAPPTRDHALADTDKYRRQLPNGSLVIEGMSAELAGRYQCVASADGLGTIVSRVASVLLAELPEVSIGARSVLGVAGAPALLPCALHAAPPVALRVLSAGGAAPDRRVYGAARVHAAPPTLKLNVTWLKNGSPLSAGAESARVAVTPSGALELDPARAHDAARYRCRVSIAHAPHLYATSEEVELRISTEVGAAESPPRFIATPQPLTVMEGASVTFDCAAVGNPKPEMSWLNNGVAIDLSDLDSRFYLAGSGSLRVVSARALDAGAYTCRAHNRLDSVDHTTHLHVLSAPRVQLPDGAVVVARARGDVTLRCEPRGRPAPAVAWLKDGEPLSPNNHDIALVDGASLRIQGVLRVDAGMFQCAASSPAGSAVASLRLVVLPPDDETDTHDVSMQHSTSRNIDPKSFFSSLAPAANMSSTYTKLTFKPSYTNSTQDIFNSLISSSPFADQTLDPTPEDPDFLGETSSAYTSHPETEFDDTLELDRGNNLDNSFHAAEGLDLDELGRGNASVVSAPRALRAVIVKHRFVTLSWEEPEERQEEVTGYAVIYKVKGSERVRVWRGGAARHEMNVASLHPNTTYQFAVLAYTEHALSPPAQMIEVHTPEEELTHGPPLDVRVEAAGAHALRVTWAAPAPGPAPAPPPLKYTVHYTEAESGREQVQWAEADAAGGGACTLAGLRAAAAYWVRVAAAGGAPGAEVRARTPGDAPAAPPDNVTAVATGATSILVRWEAPAPRTHRGALTGYKVRYRALPAAPHPAPSAATPSGAGGAPAGGGARRKADSLTTPADVRRAELRDLDASTTYQVRVCAMNANGSGPFSEWAVARTLPAHQRRGETSVPPQPPPLTTRAGRDWISVWWSEEGAGGGSGGEEGVVVRGYWLGWGVGVPDEHSRELPAHAHSHVVRGLESNSEYVISLRASNTLGVGAPVYATVRTRPAAADDELGDDEDEDEDEPGEEEDDAPPLIPPVGLKVIMLSGSTAVVYWTDPTLPKGQTATDGRRYVVRWAPPGGRARTFNATDLNCMLDDLKPFTHYEFAVKLIKGSRESAWSMLVSNTSLEAAPASPPRELRASPAAPPARAVDLVWAPPARPNGIITGYVVMYAAQRGGGAGGGDEWAAVAVAGERARARVDRLRARTPYLFKVQARNSKGLGPFGAPVAYTTAVESGESGGLASATSAWLWASAGGACAVLALAAALALSLCCRRSHPPLSPDTSTYQKSSASAAIKPPDLWIHHDQMELKHMDKSLHSSAMSGGSVEAANALVSSTLTLGRAGPPPAEYEPARHAPHAHAPPASLDRRHYVPTYVESSRAGSRAGSDDTCALRASPAAAAAAAAAYRCDRCDYMPMTGVGVGVGSMSNMGGMGMGGLSGMGGLGGMSGLSGMSVGCASTCERRQHARGPHQLPDQSTPLLAGMGGAGGGAGSPQPSLASLHHHLPPPAPCGGACPLGAPAPAPGWAPLEAGAAAGGGAGGGGDIYASAARERGHYVAYEPLGHYTHRDSLSSDTALGSSVGTVGGPPGGGGGGSLQRGGPRAHGGPPPAMHSFSDTSDHSTPTHSSRSVRESSPYKKSASSSPGHAPNNRLHLGGGGGGGGVGACASELEPLTPSRSTERLAREMHNLEGLMKDLSAITHHQFHC